LVDWRGAHPFYLWFSETGLFDGGFPMGTGSFAYPSLVLSPTSLTFNAVLTRADPQIQTVQVTNGGGGTLNNISISEGADWLVVWIGGSGDTQRIMNRVDIEGLELGTYTATVTVSCSNADNSPITYLVTLTIGIHADSTPLEPSIIIWVATTGNDTTGTGSQTNPYLTIERALQDFVSGSQIRIVQGTYTPTDTIAINNLEGSIFSETPGGAIIQPQMTSQYGAAIAITNSSRFTVQGVHIKQSTETVTATSVPNTVGLYATAVQNFVAHTVTVSDFSCPSGCAGIWAIGSGRIQDCVIEDITIDNGDLYGIYANGISVIDNTVRRLIDRGNSSASGIYVINDYTPPSPTPTPPSGPFGGHATLTNDLVLYYMCNDDAANTTVLDSTPNNYDAASLHDTDEMADVDAPAGASNSFSTKFAVIGKHSWTIPNISGEWNNDATDEATLVLWLKLVDATPSATTRTGICHLSTGIGSASVYPWTDGKLYMGQFHNVRADAIVPDATVDRETWHMLTITEKSGTGNYKWYQNLIEILSTGGVGFIGGRLDSAGLLFGKSNGPYYFDGNMMGIGIWNRVLTTQERTDLYNGGDGLFYS